MKEYSITHLIDGGGQGAIMKLSYVKIVKIKSESLKTLEGMWLM